MRKDTLAQTGIIAIILIFVIVLIVVAFASIQQERSPAKISVEFPPYASEAGEAVRLPLDIRNDGGEASQVTVSINSEAFGEIGLNPFDLGSGRKITVYAQTKITDVRNGWYNVTVAYSYKDVNGTHTPTKVKAQFYVIPHIRIVDFAWEGQPISINRWPPKDTIGRTDNTKVYFKVKSESETSTYSRLTASTKLETQAQGLIIMSDAQPIEDVGPKGLTRKEYSFTISSNNTPPGKYKIAVIVASDGQQAAQHTFELTVS